MTLVGNKSVIGLVQYLLPSGEQTCLRRARRMKIFGLDEFGAYCSFPSSANLWSHSNNSDSTGAGH